MPALSEKLRFEATQNTHVPRARTAFAHRPTSPSKHSGLKGRNGKAQVEAKHANSVRSEGLGNGA